MAFYKSTGKRCNGTPVLQNTLNGTRELIFEVKSNSVANEDFYKSVNGVLLF
jgi:hypothetical protein